MKFVSFIVVLLLNATTTQCQRNDKTSHRQLNNLMVNLGDGSGLSLRYERLLPINAKLFIAGNIGIGYAKDITSSLFLAETPYEQYLSFPYGFSIIFGNTENCIEMGIGHSTLTFNNGRKYFTYPLVGYRLLPFKSNNLMMRAFLCYPFGGFQSDDKITFLPGGVSFGLSF